MLNIYRKNSQFKLKKARDQVLKRRVKYKRILKNVIFKNIFDLYILSVKYQITSKVDNLIETISGGKHPKSVQKIVIYLPLVKSVNIIGSFLLD